MDGGIRFSKTAVRHCPRTARTAGPDAMGRRDGGASAERSCPGHNARAASALMHADAAGRAREARDGAPSKRQTGGDALAAAVACHAAGALARTRIAPAGRGEDESISRRAAATRADSTQRRPTDAHPHALDSDGASIGTRSVCARLVCPQFYVRAGRDDTCAMWAAGATSVLPWRDPSDRKIAAQRGGAASCRGATLRTAKMPLSAAAQRPAVARPFRPQNCRSAQRRTERALIRARVRAAARRAARARGCAARPRARARARRPPPSPRGSRRRATGTASRTRARTRAAALPAGG